MSALFLQLILDALGQGFYSFTSSRTVGDPVGGGLNLGLAIHASLGALNVILELHVEVSAKATHMSFDDKGIKLDSHSMSVVENKGLQAIKRS